MAESKNVETKSGGSIRLLLLSDFHYNHYGRRGETDADESELPVFTGEKMLERLRRVLAERAGAADHVIIAGDLANGARSREYAPLTAMLGKFTGEKLSVVPGNHDMCLLPIENMRHAKYMARFVNNFGAFMTSNGTGGAGLPYVKDAANGMLIIGLDTTAGFGNRLKHSVFGLISGSVGRVGRPQLGLLARVVSAEKNPARRIVIVMHHDPFVKQNPYTKLSDLEAFKRLVGELSATRKLIIVCGHDHRGVIDYFNPNVLHIQPPSFCGKRAGRKGGFFDITIDDGLKFKLND